MDNDKFNTRDSEKDDLLSVLLAVKANILKECRVATIAKVKSIDTTTSFAKVQTYPLLKDEIEQTIDAYIPSTITLTVNDLVLVIYTDRKFIFALRKLKTNQKPSALDNDSELHLKSYGIITTIL